MVPDRQRYRLAQERAHVHGPRPAVAAVAAAELGELGPRRRGALSGVLAAGALTMVGAASGYYGSMFQGADPQTWVPAGAAAGLLLAWGTIRWMAPKHDRHGRADANAG